MRILIADALPDDQLARLTDTGHEVVDRPDLGADDLAGALTEVDPDVLVVRSTKVSAAALDAGGSLGLVVRSGAGVNTIDVAHAARLGIHVCNVPGTNSVAVAELTMGLVCALDRDLPDNVAELRAGRWDKGRFSEARGLKGRTIGIVGLGAIGLAVARRATAFEMTVLAVAKAGRDADTLAEAEAAGVEFVDDLDTLLARSDVVSLHVPLSDATRGMVDRDFLARCRDGAWIVNTSRGEVVDGDALLEALDTRGMRAALDVFPDEPGGTTAEWTSPLSTHPSVYGTHHIGASTDQAQDATAGGTVDTILGYARGEVVNCVNLETQPVGTCSLTVRHRDEVGVLSEVLGVLKGAAINVGQMENRIFAGSEAAVATIICEQPVTDELADRIRGVEHVLGVRVNRDA
ncbi:MAG: NAD(P)-dependent oxidoreductase [Actinomycetes bacterium]